MNIKSLAIIGLALLPRSRLAQARKEEGCTQSNVGNNGIRAMRSEAKRLVRFGHDLGRQRESLT